MDLRGRFWPGIDDAVLQKLQDERSGSAWLGYALAAFIKHVGPDLLGEAGKDTSSKRVTAYSISLPRWAMAYIGRLPYGYQSKLLRAAVWFYLGRLSTSMDLDLAKFLAEVKMVIEQNSKLAFEEPVSTEDRALVETLMNQF